MSRDPLAAKRQKLVDISTEIFQMKTSKLREAQYAQRVERLEKGAPQAVEKDLLNRYNLHREFLKNALGDEKTAISLEITCSIPDDHIDPRRSALFMARSVLRDIQTGDTNACSTS